MSCTERYWDESADESDSPAKDCGPLVEVIGFPHSAESRSLRAASSSMELKREVYALNRKQGTYWDSRNTANGKGTSIVSHETRTFTTSRFVRFANLRDSDIRVHMSCHPWPDCGGPRARCKLRNKQDATSTANGPKVTRGKMIHNPLSLACVRTRVLVGGSDLEVGGQGQKAHRGRRPTWSSRG